MAEISSTAVTAICHCCKVFCFAVCSDCAGKPTGDAEYLVLVMVSLEKKLSNWAFVSSIFAYLNI